MAEEAIKRWIAEFDAVNFTTGELRDRIFYRFRHHPEEIESALALLRQYEGEWARRLASELRRVLNLPPEE